MASCRRRITVKCIIHILENVNTTLTIRKSSWDTGRHRRSCWMHKQTDPCGVKSSRAADPFFNYSATKVAQCHCRNAAPKGDGEKKTESRSAHTWTKRWVIHYLRMTKNHPVWAIGSLPLKSIFYVIFWGCFRFMQAHDLGRRSWWLVWRIAKEASTLTN